MILAFNKTRKSKQTFDTMKEFEMAVRCKFAELELLQVDYDPYENLDKIEVEEIKPVKIKPKKITKEIIDAIEILPKKLTKEFTDKYTVSTFRKNINNFTEEELRIFINFDTRATIKNEATKELKKRN